MVSNDSPGLADSLHYNMTGSLDEADVKAKFANLMASNDEYANNLKIMVEVNNDLEAKCAALSSRLIELEAPRPKHESCIQIGTLDTIKKGADAFQISFTSTDVIPKAYSFGVTADEAARIAPLLGKQFILTIREK